MTNAGFWDPLISPWWRSWGILYTATCQVFSTSVNIELSSRSVEPRIAVSQPHGLLVGFTRVAVRSVPASWPRLRVLGGAASPSLDASRVHSVPMAVVSPKLLEEAGVSSFHVHTASVPLGKGLAPPLNSIACGAGLLKSSHSAPLLEGPEKLSIPLGVLRTAGKPLFVPEFKRTQALCFNIPQQARAKLASSSLVFRGNSKDNLEKALWLAVVRSPLPAHRFKVEQRHEFRNQLALRLADVPPEKILIRYVVDRIPANGIARFTPREDGTLSWTWADTPATQLKKLNGPHDPIINAPCGGWVVVGQRLDTRVPVMTVVFPPASGAW